jgi:predicted metal-dependent phosphoesterase TrpH
MSPNSTIDLHLHSYYSDGRASPAEILHYAAKIGLRTVSITDHDNLNAAEEASYVAGELGLELIPGIELTSRWDDCPAPAGSGPQALDIDVLGYFVDSQNLELQEFTKTAMSGLRARVSDCCRLLTEAGYPVTIYDVLEENPRYPGAVPLIAALWHKGYAGSWNEAFPIFNQYWAQAPTRSAQIEEAIEVIHQAGGAAVLAHPILVNCGTGWIQRDQVRRLKEIGLDGLEVYHPRLDAEARAYFQNLAREFDLATSGGSDEHGWREGFYRMGTQPIPYSAVQALEARSRASTR